LKRLGAFAFGLSLVSFNKQKYRFKNNKKMAFDSQIVEVAIKST